MHVVDKDFLFDVWNDIFQDGHLTVSYQCVCDRGNHTLAISNFYNVGLKRKYPISLPSAQLFFRKSIEKVINHYSEVTDSFTLLWILSPRQTERMDKKRLQVYGICPLQGHEWKTNHIIKSFTCAVFPKSSFIYCALVVAS